MSSIIRAWDYSWQDIWQPLRAHDDAPTDMFMELYPELSKAFSADSLDMGKLYESSNSPDEAERSFHSIRAATFSSERLLIGFFSEAYSIVDEFGAPSLTAHYASLLQAFFERYNLRFRVQVPFEIVIDPGGLFCSMLDEIAKKTESDPDVRDLDTHLRRAFNLLARDGNLVEVSSCISRTCNYLEGLASAMPGVRPSSLTGMLPRMKDTWPHAGVRSALSSLYGFCSEYPNLRHGGNPETRIRALELRDAVVIPMALLAFSGYFVQIDYSELLCIRANNVPDEPPVPSTRMASDLRGGVQG